MESDHGEKRRPDQIHYDDHHTVTSPHANNTETEGNQQKNNASAKTSTLNLPLSFDIVAVLVMLATIGSTIFSCQNVRLTRDAVEATKDAATAALKSTEIAVKQLEATDRPWVKLLGIKRPRLTFTGPSFQNKFGTRDQAWLHVTLETKNIGRSTATHVRARAILVLHPWENGWGDFKSEQKMACDSLSQTNDGPTDVVLFPDDTFDGFNYGASEILTTEHVNRNAKVTFIAPALVGCIDYRFYASSEHHQTAFVYELFHADDRSRFFSLGRDMTTSQLLLIRNQQYDYAN